MPLLDTPAARADFLRACDDATLRGLADHFLDLRVKGIEFRPEALDEISGEICRRMNRRLSPRYSRRYI